MLSCGQISRAFDQPLLGYGVGSGMLNDLQDSSGLGKPVADATDNKRLKGNCRDSLAVAFGFRRPFQQ